MTIARDRWQAHFKSRGRHYHDEAERLRQLHGIQPLVGADVCALALHGLAEVLETARLGRLTRNQHVLLRLGELIARVEGAATMARRAARLVAGRGHPKTDRRFDAAACSAISRIAAREAALAIAADGVRLCVGAGGVRDGEMAAFETGLGLMAIHRAQAGLMADMGIVADVLYDRA